MTYGHITRVLTVRERKMEVSLEVVRHQPTVGVSRRNSWRDGTIIIEILGDGERFRRLQYRVVASRNSTRVLAAYYWSIGSRVQLAQEKTQEGARSRQVECRKITE